MPKILRGVLRRSEGRVEHARLRLQARLVSRMNEEQKEEYVKKKMGEFMKQRIDEHEELVTRSRYLNRKAQAKSKVYVDKIESLLVTEYFETGSTRST